MKHRQSNVCLPLVEEAIAAVGFLRGRATVGRGRVGDMTEEHSARFNAGCGLGTVT